MKPFDHCIKGPELNWSTKHLSTATSPRRPTSSFSTRWRSSFRYSNGLKFLLWPEPQHEGRGNSSESQVLPSWSCCCLLSSADGVSDRVEGEHSGRSTEGVAPQHGLQPERPLPAALFCNTAGASVKGLELLRFTCCLLFFCPSLGVCDAVCLPLPRSFRSCCSRRRRSSAPTCACGSWEAAAAASAPSELTPAHPSTSWWGKILRLEMWVETWVIISTH